jgi:hypothetical protein
MATRGPPTRKLVLLGYLILENHLHFIASAEDLPNEVGDFKSYTARRIIDYLSERQELRKDAGAGSRYD